jgi:hypothetical protein
LRQQLTEQIPDATIFMDPVSAEAAADAVGRTEVLILVKGRDWATLTDAAGNQLLDDPSDRIRLELKRAVELGTFIIPVSGDGARPLDLEDLPAELSLLAKLNIVHLMPEQYEINALFIAGIIQIIRLLFDAEELAFSIADLAQQAEVMAATAEAIAFIDPRRALWYLDQAEHIAQSITDADAMDAALYSVAQSAEKVDRKRPERIAGLIGDKERRIAALSVAVRASAAADPDGAALLCMNANRRALSITDAGSRGLALSYVASAWQVIDADRAEYTAMSIEGESWKSFTLAELAAKAAADPDRARRLFTEAERAALSIADPWDKSWALTSVVEQAGATDPDRAARLLTAAEQAAATVDSPTRRAQQLGRIAETWAALDPGQALRVISEMERLARTVGDDVSRNSILGSTVKPLTVLDLNRAERVTWSLDSRYGSRETADLELMLGLAKSDPARAESIARGARERQSFMLYMLATKLAENDPDGAERLVPSIDDKDKAMALIRIAKAQLA